ncbi:PLP-dependent aminotransferase family protein [Frankia sp. Ag45/Mut15]|uniref:PLP-dependent aminotransferase family protein n=1 Tax=Frankia umida TaxID=573489 RepID=A0ABT0K174_9ACTN|nr:PLP-dependent aminotransferase family protein [Frankia umida]MCK9877476.1 PLP-dependent aminotransferase family protein [Frankia umida]
MSIVSPAAVSAAATSPTATSSTVTGPTVAAPVALAARASRLRTSPVRDLLALTADPELISFAGGLPAPELFDAEGLRRSYAEVLVERPREVLQYSTSEGDPALRAVLADRLTRRGLGTEADDLVITSGSQQALALLTAALLDPGDTVVVEEPTYLAALQAFDLAGARVVAVPTDDDGVRPDDLEKIVGQHRPRLLYLVPNFQNPTGRTMSAARRHAVAEIAARRGMWIIEDDPYGELRLSGQPQPWIAGLAAAGDRTVLLGSLSKTMAPGMRLGWLRAPAALRRACVIAKQATDLHTSTVDQAAAARYLTTADPDARIALMCAAYRERLDALLAGLPAALPAGSHWNRPAGGMFVWVRLPAGLDATALLPAALAQRVAYVPGAAFYPGAADPRTLRLSFTTHSPRRVAEGLDRLGAAFAGATGRATGRG